MIQRVNFMTPTIRKTAATLMISAAALAGGGYAMAKPAETTALYPTEQVNNTTNSNAVTALYQHNKKLDNTLMKFAESNNDKKLTTEFCNTQYKQYGTYLGSIQIQRMIDYNALGSYTDGKIKQFTEPDFASLFVLEQNKQLDGIMKVKSKMMDWYGRTYSVALSKRIAQLIQKEGNTPSYVKCSEMLNDFVDNDLSKILPKSTVNAYYNDLNSFKNAQKDKNSVQAKSDYLAYKMYLIDIMSMNANLKSLKAFDDGYVSPTGKGSAYYFVKAMNYVSPTP